MFVTSNIMWVKSSITYAAGALFTKKSSTITYHKSYRHVQDLQEFFLVRNFVKRVTVINLYPKT